MNRCATGFGNRHDGGFGRLALTLIWCASPLVAASMAGATPAADFAGITAITLERDCNGCPSGSLLQLRRDGTATLTSTGKARLGTQDKTARGSVAPAQFGALAQLVVRQRFFELDDTYEDAGTRDGPWTAVTVGDAGHTKRVFAQDGTAPAALKAIHAAVDALQAAIAFTSERTPGAR